VAGRIRDEDKQAVREKADIVQVVSQHLQLKKAGGDRLVGICPFHSEKTPSFSVTPSKQVYYCFGCGEGGDVFTFLQKVEDLSFNEAVERLAKDAGITLRYEGQTAADRHRTGHRQAIHKALDEAGTLYHRTLLEGREGADARAYLQSRGVSEESVRRFLVGYAPGYPDFVLRRLSGRMSAELLIEAGLVTKDSSGELRDRFRGRVMFPIHDLSGNAVGFGGRHLARAGQPAAANVAKYVNSAESPVYHKGSILYNLNRAKGDITRTGRVFLVEGYTDVIALDQAGVPNAVATCGTALGDDHLRLLARFTERAVLAFDSDEAGARAAERAYRFHQDYPIDLSVLILPAGQDPADFATASGGEAFLELAAKATPLIEYMIERSLTGKDLSGVEDRARAVRTGLALVAGLEDPVRRQEYARLLAGKVGESEVSVMLQLDRMAAETGEGPAPVVQRAGRARGGPDEEVEADVLKLVIQNPGLAEGWQGRLSADHFAKPTHRRVYELVDEAWRAGGDAALPAAASLVALAHGKANGEQLARTVAALAVEPPRSPGEPTADYVERQFLRLEEFLLKRRADAIRKELQRLNPLKVPEEHLELFQEMAELDGAARRAREAAEAVGTSG
jgi:DNA primase